MSQKSRLRGVIEALRLDALGPQIAVFLSMALLPIGFLAIYQTQKATQESSRVVQATYVALTADAVGDQRALVLRTIGVTESMGELIIAVDEDWDRCTRRLTDLVARVDKFVRADFIDKDGTRRCSSSGGTQAAVDPAFWSRLQRNLVPKVTFEAPETGTGSSVVSISNPIYRGETWIGHVVVSLPGDALAYTQPDDLPVRPIDIVSFSANGRVLVPDAQLAQIRPFLPEALNLNAMPQFARKSVQLQGRDGKTYRYVVDPLVPNAIYALGIWPENAQGRAVQLIRPEIFPFLMWVASMIVAYFALDRLVLRHVRTINTEMRIFGRDRRIISAGRSESMPEEFRRLQNQFLRMAEAVLHDEEELEKAVSQKSILLKEVHHRVKNNLQMISSIMNMQIRSSKSAEMKSVLGGLQDRILGLAVVHRTLHEIGDMGRIDAGHMLNDLLDQTVAGTAAARKMKITRDFGDIELFPSQTVPLSLLVSELVANAVKFSGKPGDSRPEMTIRFVEVAENEVELTVKNTTDGPVSDTQDTGLGRRLVAAFASQLNATTKVTDGDGWYSVAVRFAVDHDMLAQRDY